MSPWWSCCCEEKKGGPGACCLGTDACLHAEDQDECERRFFGIFHEGLFCDTAPCDFCETCAECPRSSVDTDFTFDFVDQRGFDPARFVGEASQLLTRRSDGACLYQPQGGAAFTMFVDGAPCDWTLRAFYLCVHTFGTWDIVTQIEPATGEFECRGGAGPDGLITGPAHCPRLVTNERFSFKGMTEQNNRVTIS